MKINIASTHRFHLLDLARELSNEGYDVAFYSFVPQKRCIKFGLPQECCHSFTWLAVPFLILQKIFPKSQRVTKYWDLAIDYYMSWFMRPCDIYIALGTVYLKSLRTAKKKYKAKTILEWGSKHIEEQQRILKEIHAPLNEEFFNERSRQGYCAADYIAIASEHVRYSFLKRGIPKEKLFINHYGVELSMFHPSSNKEKLYDVIMVGGWSYRKGCDLIVEAIKKTHYRFLHVGSIVDCSFPEDDERFTHIPSVDQSKLINYYHYSKVFLLPSREEGLAMVQAQAVACNLPLVGSKDSGAEDLKNMVEKPEFVTIIKDYTVESILEALHIAINQVDLLANTTYAGRALEKLTWSSYGKRYSKFLQMIYG